MRSAFGMRDGDRASRRTTGSESVTWRGRASSGATPGTGSSHRSWGEISRSPVAATQAPSGGPADRSPDAVPRVDALAGRGRRHGARCLGWPAATALRRLAWRRSGRRRGPGGHRGPRRARTGCRRARAAATDPTPPDGSPCSRSPAVRTIRSWPSARQPDHLEPAVRVGDVEAASHRSTHRAPTSTLCSPATTRTVPPATSTSAIWAVSSTAGPR